MLTSCNVGKSKNTRGIFGRFSFVTVNLGAELFLNFTLNTDFEMHKFLQFAQFGFVNINLKPAIKQHRHCPLLGLSWGK